MNNQIIKIGCEVLLIKGDAILLGKRKNCYGEGTWAVPGGHLEYGESLLECIKRELLEELGIDGTELELVTMVDNIDERGHYLHMSFLLKKYLGELQNSEPDLCYEWKFFDISMLPENIFKPHQKILRNYFNKILYF